MLSNTSTLTEEPPKKPRRQTLLTKIDISKIPSVISIFDCEHFKMNACLLTNMQQDGSICSPNTGGPTGPATGGPTGPATTGPTAAPTPPTNATGPTGPALTNNQDTSITRVSEYLGKNTEIVPETSVSYEYKTRKEFERLYFASGLKKEEKKLLLKVFRFVFGKYESELDRTVLKKLLTPFDKVPCNEGEQKDLWKLFHDSILYRIHGSADGSMGLSKEIDSLRKILPQDNQEYIKKQTLRAQLYRMAAILKERNRTCVVFSNQGADIHLSEYHTAFIDLLRKTVKGLIRDKVPVTQEEKDAHYTQFIQELKGLKPNKGNNREIYDDMVSIVQHVFDQLDPIDKTLESTSTVFSKMDELLDSLQAKVQTGGGDAHADADADAEEYERVYSSAMEHLAQSGDVLEQVYDILGGTDLESAIETAVSRKGFDLHAVVSRLHEIEGNRHVKSFLRCVETLLEIKERQYAAYTPSTLPPGKERYSHTLATYPSLKQYIPNFRSKDASCEKTLRRVYPYANALLEDISILRKTPDPCCMYYKGLLTKVPAKARKACKKIVDSIPRCQEIVEETLTVTVGASDFGEPLVFTPVSLPKGFSLLAEAIRTNLSDIPSLPITIHEKSPKEFEEVLGDTPFLLIGSGTIITGIKNYEIDVTDNIDEIRKGEISIGALMFLYLFIKCDGDIDA